jgi:hypothetical protein
MTLQHSYKGSVEVKHATNSLVSSVFPRAEKFLTETLNIPIQLQTLLLKKICKCKPLLMKRLLQAPVCTKRAPIRKMIKG